MDAVAWPAELRPIESSWCGYIIGQAKLVPRRLMLMRRMVQRNDEPNAA